MKNAIKLAIEGGFRNERGLTWEYVEKHYSEYEKENLLLRATFWQALGKAMGWPEWRCQCGQYYVGEDKRFKLPQGKRPKTCGNCDRSARTIKSSWLANWHRFIDHLAEGKDAEMFFNDLLK